MYQINTGTCKHMYKNIFIRYILYIINENSGAVGVTGGERRGHGVSVIGRK